MCKFIIKPDNSMQENSMVSSRTEKTNNNNRTEANSWKTGKYSERESSVHVAFPMGTVTSEGQCVQVPSPPSPMDAHGKQIKSLVGVT